VLGAAKTAEPLIPNNSRVEVVRKTGENRSETVEKPWHKDFRPCAADLAEE
jgi:hypothetical protein